MYCLVDKLVKEHDKPRHKGKYRQQAQEDSLDKHYCKVCAYPELHKGKSDKSRNSGKAAGGNFGNSFAQSGYAGFAGGEMLVLLAVAVYQDYSVVNGKGKLKNYCYRVGNKRNSSQKKIGAHIQHSGRAECHDKHGKLRIGS